MLTQKELDAAVRKMIANLDEVNLYFIQKIAAQIKKIGEMNPTSIHRYTIMLEMGADIADISGKLQAATRLTQQQTAVVYNTALQDNFTDPRFKAALAAHPLPREENQRLVQYTRNIAAQTSGALQNLSNTTAISVPYQQAIDKAILSVSTGMTDYKSAMRQTIKDIGLAGMQVQAAITAALIPPPVRTSLTGLAKLPSTAPTKSARRWAMMPWSCPHISTAPPTMSRCKVTFSCWPNTPRCRQAWPAWTWTAITLQDSSVLSASGTAGTLPRRSAPNTRCANIPTTNWRHG